MEEKGRSLTVFIIRIIDVGLFQGPLPSASSCIQAEGLSKNDLRTSYFIQLHTIERTKPRS